MSQTQNHPLASSKGHSDLYRRLVTRGWEFDFFQAIWLLERYADTGVRIGHRGPVGKEGFRFRPDVSMGFAATDIRRIATVTSPENDQSFFRIDIAFMGLYGTTTPLPLHYAVDILRSVDQAGSETTDSEPTLEVGQHSSGIDTADSQAPATPMRDFLDVFHHRLISLFYRTWLKYRYERTFGLPGRDTLTDYLLWLIGVSPNWDEKILHVSPVRLIRYAGLLTQHPRSLVSLEGLLQDYWGDIGVESHSCLGRWIPVPAQDRNLLRDPDHRPYRPCRLGIDLTVGEEVYDLSGAFTMTFGPTDWATYLTFLPGEPRWVQTCALVKIYCTDPMSLTVEMRIREHEIPELKLASDNTAARLGMTGWVRTVPIKETSVTFDATYFMWSRSPQSEEQHQPDMSYSP